MTYYSVKKVTLMNLSQYLYVFNYICTQGVKSENVYYTEDFIAWHDFDGYTCYIGYKDVVLTLNFHGNNSFTYQDKKSFENFNVKIQNFLPELITSEL